MGRYLIVANQTLGGEELDAQIQRRIAEGDADFHVVVPMTEPQLESRAWAPHDTMFQIPVDVSGDAEAFDEARQRTHHRLERILDHIRSAGGEADGEIGDADPYTAAKNVLSRLDFDEIIVSTLPSGISRWLKMDLLSRLERLTDVPVTAVEAADR